MKENISELTFGGLCKEDETWVELRPDALVFDWGFWLWRKQYAIPWNELKIVTSASIGYNHPNFDKFGVALLWTPGSPNQFSKSIYLPILPGGEFHTELRRLLGLPPVPKLYPSLAAAAVDDFLSLFRRRKSEPPTLQDSQE